MKLFFGEYEPANRELSIGNARVAFLNAVRMHIPKVLEDLSGQPFELYKSIGAPFMQWWQVRYGRRETVALRESLLEWSKAWRLEQEWCLELALRTLWNWNSYPPDLEKLKWQQGGGGWMVPTNEEERRFIFEHPGWEPTYDYRKKIKEEMTKAFNEKLEEYLDHIESLVVQRGFVKTKRKNEPEHFEWLACFQVKGMTYEEIRDAFRPQDAPQPTTYLSDDTKAVRKAINELAKFIDLPLRDDGCRPGRRAKTPTASQ